jgi:hypothetical protein
MVDLTRVPENHGHEGNEQESWQSAARVPVRKESGISPSDLLWASHVYSF